ncbi:MAG: choloylglycine hydrolase, partial [Bacteroidales bacterium]|nr:choloylglycine hydrolase [Bacteroidales bacterium]
MKRHRKNRRLKKFLLGFAIAIAAFIIAFLIYFKIAVTITPPEPNDLSILDLERIKIGNDFYVCANSWLKKSNTGLWELYIEGDAFERGVINGKLTKELIEIQEEAFVEQINKMISSKFYLNFLKYFVAWFNRNINNYITDEYLLEIYGVSLSASDEFLYIAPNYHRILDYHAAHDIGHALQDMNMAGCTSFSAWGNKTKDSSLIVGRNFDFYVGDEFAKNKIIMFVNPDNGYKFMMVTWAGMIGAVSGMNEKGLTVTINAAKSVIPLEAKTPISILAREILQYTSDIDEAYAIAKKREIFVSESLMIGSVEDNKTAIIEKTPERLGLFETDENYIICSNHFQSDVFSNDSLNLKNIKESSSIYRYKRVDELIAKFPEISVNDAAEILRDQKGLKNKNIGMGNEKAINQLIAHHSVIFEPAKKLAWISVGPFQLGEYVCYNMDKIFNDFVALRKKIEIYETTLTIPADSFLYSQDYQNFIKFKEISQLIQSSIENNEKIVFPDKNYISTNPEFFMTYSLLGDYYKKSKQYDKAIEYYNIALKKEIPTLQEK